MQKQFTVEFAGTSYPAFFITERAEAEEVIRHLANKPGVLAADTETAGLPGWKHVPTAALSPHLGHPRLLQLFTGTGALVIDLFATGKIDLKTLFNARPSVFHNMTFDYKMLQKHYDIGDTVDMHCTCIMARCIFHAIYPDKRSASLKDVAHALFGDLISKQAATTDWSTPELTFEQVKYAALDAVVQMRIYEKLSAMIDTLGLRRVYELYRKAQIVLCEMELHGITIDQEKHKINIVSWREQLMDAFQEVRTVTGLDNITDSKLAGWLQETLPPEVLDIWPRTEVTKDGRGGKLQTDSNTFVDFSFLDIVKPFSRYQKLKKLTTSFGVNLFNAINPATGKLHPNYTVAGAKTGRLSCSGPNIQQQPRSADMRSIYIPSPGKIMVVSDYSQIEVRNIAEFSNDEMMLKAYREGLDIYTFTAAHLTGTKYEDIGKKSPERQKAKALVLGLNYGLGAKKFSHYAKKGYDVTISPEESNALVKSYRQLYSGLRDWQQQQVSICPAKHYTAFSVLGKSRKMTEDDYYCACLNHPVQASSAEIMLTALVKTHAILKGTSAKLLMTVHDEIVLECAPADLEEVNSKLTTSMLEAYLEILPSGRTTRGLIEPTSGVNWAEAKD